MTVAELIGELQQMDPNSEVKLFGYIGEKDDYQLYDISVVHNLWRGVFPEAYCAIEFDREQGFGG